ncbi:MAG: hypothetical protein L0206_23000 [Actinobacteria bacterium]|nr:hypothetical protein [Actinomycetota bacterium]
MDQEIELAEPNFITLEPEGAAEAVRLLAALIRAVPAHHTDSTFPPRLDSPSPEELADGSPSVPGDRGKAGTLEDAGGGP